MYDVHRQKQIMLGSREHVADHGQVHGAGLKEQRLVVAVQRHSLPAQLAHSLQYSYYPHDQVAGNVGNLFCLLENPAWHNPCIPQHKVW